jgi:predicted transposase YbfD/YdcC
VLTVTGLGLDFPHVTQAVKIHHYRTDAKSGKTTRQTVHAITDMASHQASPQRLGQLARGHWGIESVHHVRDTTFAEDASQICTGHGPANMATLRNLAVNTSATPATAASPPGYDKPPTNPSRAHSTCSDSPDLHQHMITRTLNEPGVPPRDVRTPRMCRHGEVAAHPTGGPPAQAGVSCHCWLAPLLTAHCTTWAPSLVDWPDTSAARLLARLTMV